ncbi:hypothetical protein [Thermus islandicus]|uniref:hypothetical protein n=1 Tax=Thermus islandicus TaxID=540988 RepID=UPI0004296100|nr:hypothetical protein [Thermus islandicus]
MRLFAAGFFYLPVYLLAAEKARTPLEATLPQTLLYALGFASLWVGALLDRKRVLALSTLGQAALALALLPAPGLPLLYLLVLLLLFELLDRFRALGAGLYLRSLVPKELVGRGMEGVAFISGLLAPLGPLLGRGGPPPPLPPGRRAPPRPRPLGGKGVAVRGKPPSAGA